MTAERLSIVLLFSTFVLVGEAPRVPVLWAVPEDQAEVQPPFGRKLVLA